MEGSDNAGRVTPQHTVWQRCLEALAAVSTHHSIVQETVPILLDYVRQTQKGKCSSRGNADFTTAV